MSYESADIIYTNNAANKVTSMLVGDNDTHLRVYIVGGGCSGFSYGFTFDDKHKEGDSIVFNGEATLVVDPMSYQYLVGSTVDYLEDLQGARFIISNPNAKTTCGCGSSFSV
jgi:iron-sulfur cluster insertion protein